MATISDSLTAEHAGFNPSNVVDDGEACPLCDSHAGAYLFISHGSPVYRCLDCGLTRLHPRPTRSAVQLFYTKGSGHDPFTFDTRLVDSPTEREAASAYLHTLRQRGAPQSDMLVIAPHGHPFAAVAREQGYDVKTVVDAMEFFQSALVTERYASTVVIFQIEGALNPIALLEKVHATLQSDGVLLLVTPSLDSWSAKFFRDQWTEWRPENLYYFDSQTIQSALLRSGFGRIEIRRDRRRYSLYHLYQRACAYPRTNLTRLIRLMYHLVPDSLHLSLRLTLPSSGIVVTAQRVERRSRPLLSIVMPVYNELPTFATTMNAVLAKQVPGMDKEIIVVESNSTDGTREAVLEFENCTGVRLILEDQARGKGRAVRAGFNDAQGDFILIQDADREYDVNDYDMLLKPLTMYQRAFVLGSRHIGDWKVRHFNDQLGLAAFFNLGHFIFVTLLNFLYGQKLKDPFTMYKVFRRDCLHGLTFECNRFDFDFELVIKLLRKGYQPLEIPVNYHARAPSEGKKVSVARDPLTWLKALFKYRFGRIQP